METIEKVNVAELKADIKESAEKQKWYRNQRKTVHKNCERKSGDPNDIEPWQATMDHRSNRAKLRAMYAAYAILRKQDLSEIDSGKFETTWDEDFFKTSVEKLLIKYRGEED